MSKTIVKARVQSIQNHGKKSSYVVTTSDDLDGSVTFSLDATVWREKSKPKPRDYVCLDRIRQTTGGWRAEYARFWRPSDEQQKQQPRKSARKKA